jgi:hypothetical protein
MIRDEHDRDGSSPCCFREPNAGGAAVLIGVNQNAVVGIAVQMFFMHLGIGQKVEFISELIDVKTEQFSEVLVWFYNQNSLRHASSPEVRHALDQTRKRARYRRKSAGSGGIHRRQVKDNLVTGHGSRGVLVHHHPGSAAATRRIDGSGEGGGTVLTRSIHNRTGYNRETFTAAGSRAMTPTGARCQWSGQLQ